MERLQSDHGERVYGVDSKPIYDGGALLFSPRVLLDGEASSIVEVEIRKGRPVSHISLAHFVYLIVVNYHNYNHMNILLYTSCL